ncbi:YeeE/YedE thiosulfate transporter family protein [Pseudorhodoplanes sp.]|uniref:YeeE/YedE thiosulfate transporter family protein n=1 Tax=Pseudorhodoplanes sp. TaxID=1934341 RepID=UPI002C7E487F|nr:YeeE/YedE thiosulfate transporter family protein [Pseudorhodoplanes sp.]HWV55579.1 YeeE/YedE thiosulfate transporter family protein [Pseudorhodoplanes sp.]
MLNLIIACILAAILGFAAHRASICTVRAVAEFTHSGTGYMFASIVKSALWVFAITIPVFLILPHTATAISGWQLTLTAMFGGLLFGIGAGVNGACAYATMARMIDGEIGMLLTVLGFAAGVLIFVALISTGTLARPSPAPSQLPEMIQIAPYVLMALAIVGAYEVVRLWRSRPAGSTLRSLIFAPAYRLSTAALLMGFAGGLILLIFGSPGYTTTFQQIVEAHVGTRPMPPYGRWLVLGAVLLGMFASTWQRGSFRVDWRPRLTWLRNIFGGVLMGLGCALLPGGNDALILYGIPGLSPHAIPAYIALLLGIFVALITMRAVFSVEMRVACRNDMYIADASADLAKREKPQGASS